MSSISCIISISMHLVNSVIITSFGKPIGKTIVKAGLYFKKPVVEVVRFVDKRILSWDGYPNQIPTKDKK